MLTSIESLVAGAPLPNMDKTIRIRVKRQFYYKGVLQQVGKELDYPHYMALEVIAIGKAERVEAKAPEPKAPEQKPEPEPKASAKKAKE